MPQKIVNDAIKYTGSYLTAVIVSLVVCEFIFHGFDPVNVSCMNWHISLD